MVVFEQVGLGITKFPLRHLVPLRLSGNNSFAFLSAFSP